MSAPPQSPTGIDAAQVRALLRAFFRMNFRGAAVARGARRGRGNRGIGFILGMYALIGGFLGFSALVIEKPMFYLLLMQGITFTMLGMAVLVESGQILFNPKEEDVLGALPISTRTLVAAKLLNMTGFGMMLATAFNLVPMCVALRYDALRFWTPLAHLASLAVLCLFTCAGVVLIYGIVARMVGRERFESIVSWAQVFLTIFFVVGYQMLGPVMQQVRSIDPDSVPWLWALPPRWFAALDLVLSGGAHGDVREWIGALGALAMTVALTLAGIERLAAGQDRQAALQDRPAPRPAHPARVRPARAMAPWLRGWMRDPAERGAFRLTAIYMRRDKDVRRRLYPSLAMVLVFPLYMVFGGGMDAPGQTNVVMGMSLWMLLTLPITVLETMRISAHHAASDLFYYAPLEERSALFHGVRKAGLYYVTLPVGLLMMALVAALGARVEDVVATGLPVLVMLPTISLMRGLGKDGYLPLSAPPRLGEQSGRTQGTMFATMLGLMVVLGALFGLRVLVGPWITLAIELPIVLLIHFSLLKRLATGAPPQLE